MTDLSEYKNSLVFECEYKKPRVNILHELITDFELDNDVKMCSHCFYDSKYPFSVKLKFQTRNKKKNISSKKQTKKNKSLKKQLPFTGHPPTRHLL